MKSPQDNEINDSRSSSCSNSLQLETKMQRISFILFAIGSVLSWNSLLSSMDLYVKRFPSFKPTFSLIMPLTFGLVSAQALTFFICPVLKLRYTIRVTLMFGLSMLAVISTALITFLGTKDDAATYAAILAHIFLLGIFSAILQAALTEMTAGLPALRKSLDQGMFVSMMGVNLGRMILMAIFGNETNTGTIICFSMTIVYLFGCTILASRFVTCFN